VILSDDDGVPLRSKCVDTVLCNPPFGTKTMQVWMYVFLRTATQFNQNEQCTPFTEPQRGTTSCEQFRMGNESRGSDG
jgi:tRNA G10  N-methylase Trm11